MHPRTEMTRSETMAAGAGAEAQGVAAEAGGESPRLEALLSGERFGADYLLAATGEAEARQKALDLCLEQTVEFPADLLPPGPIPEQVVGRLESLAGVGEGRWLASVSFAVETAGQGDLAQLLNVIYGNVSLKAGCRLTRLRLSDRFLGSFAGPRFGRAGLRALLRVPRRPLLCTALKPMGLSARALAEQARQCALGGIDLVKDDHGIGDQVWHPFEERVARCAAAVAEANAVTGGACRYMANVSAPAHLVLARAHRARELGAGALLVCPGLVGLDTMRLLAAADGPGLPVMSHPAFMGSFVTSPGDGIAHGLLFGLLMRLAGADMSVYPNWGGRFSFSQAECSDIARACEEPLGKLEAIFPAPGGGMTVDRAPEMLRVYGRELVVLIGGGLHRGGDGLAGNTRRLVELLDSM